tara:strand:- start:5522 stop:5695 length:174 start_codon:yes stop_codon:yes gene_type:complete
MNKEYTKLRKEIGTQAQVAKELEVDKATISKRETGAYRITKEAFLAIKRLRTELQDN